MRPFIMFPSTATDFSDNSTEAMRIITPSSATYDIEIRGAGSIHIEHPIDDTGKWQTLQLNNIIQAPIYRRGVEFPQPFRIYKITKTRKNGIPIVSADALHVFYDLNYVIFHPNGNRSGELSIQNWLNTLSFATLQPLGWWHSIDMSPNPDYWNPPIDRFTFSSNIAGEYDFYASGTVIEHLVGGADSIAGRTNADVLCDGYTVYIDSHGTHSKNNAFNIAYGLNLEGITQTVDNSNMLSLLYPTSNLDDLGLDYPTGYDLPGEMFSDLGFPFSRVGTVDFNYQADDSNKDMLWNKYLKSDSPGYFTKRSRPSAKYSVNLSSSQISDEIRNIATFEVGDSGKISDPDLGISTTQTIVAKSVDLLRQTVTSVELSNDRIAPFVADWGGIVSSGQTSLDRRVKSI